jgi:hemolysin activation/secretion protein
VQRLSDNNLLIAQLEAQLTPNGLLPSQQFVIGGGQSLRGYRQNARAGDNGVKFSLEDRIALDKDESGVISFDRICRQIKLSRRIGVSPVLHNNLFV